jgi:lipoprotein-anchoring transpeptidase ErfK/SrfK
LVSGGVTVVALCAGIGVIPVEKRPPAAAESSQGAAAAAGAAGGSRSLSAPQDVQQNVDLAPTSVAKKPERSARTSRKAVGAAVPADSGVGRRVVFDMSDQRVWLVDRDDDVASTYLVSGSVTHNLHPGTYAVYSRSRWAVGVDDSGVMQYFVRFAHGAHAAIGFHSIPTKNGHPLQTEAQLGTPQSHGCIRQALPDAIRMWNFASVGTTVVVTA